MRDTKRIGNMETNNAMMFKLGEGMAGKFNLGGAGQTGRGTTDGNTLTQSQNQLGGISSTFRSNLGGVDKSMDNFKTEFKSGFQSKFGGGLGLGSLSSVSGNQPAAGGAV